MLIANQLFLIIVNNYFENVISQAKTISILLNAKQLLS